jgi:predicted outer membrane repeat protein
MRRGGVLKSIISFLVMVLLMWGTAALAAELHVPSSDYSSIQAAIDAAVPGDVVLVAGGPYSGNLLVQKAITIKPENEANHPVIDCANAPRGFTFVGAEASEAVLNGFTITGGNGKVPEDWKDIYPDIYGWQGFGGAILFEDGASATITDCTISGNTADYGGAIAFIKSCPTISHCVIETNIALLGGGLYVKNASASDPSPALITCTIMNNSANRGGGVYLISYASPSFYNSLIAGNLASQFGGAFYCQNQCVPDIIHCTVSDNTSAGLGSEIYCISCLVLLR